MIDHWEALERAEVRIREGVSGRGGVRARRVGE